MRGVDLACTPDPAAKSCYGALAPRTISLPPPRHQRDGSRQSRNSCAKIPNLPAKKPAHWEMIAKTRMCRRSRTFVQTPGSYRHKVQLWMRHPLRFCSSTEHLYRFLERASPFTSALQSGDPGKRGRANTLWPCQNWLSYFEEEIA
jgi:hypothetical protein